MARSIVTIDDLSNPEIERVFALADTFLSSVSTASKPHRVRGRLHLANQYVLSTLFYEPSTRTRFSFEAAMIRLGGHILSSADPKSTSAAKGESLADTVRVVENYADIIVMGHPLEGAARVAADFTDLPVVNAGDGSHEHPTQTLCDLYTLRREGKDLKNLNVLLCGDLKNGRTIHSLVYALARFGANIMPLAAEGFELPEHVQDRLKRDYGCVPHPLADAKDCDVVYRTPDSPHSPSLFTRVNLDIQLNLRDATPKQIKRAIDVCYVTRLQMERLRETEIKDYPVVDARFLNKPRYRHSSVLHPLPRVAELGYDMDSDPRGIYFKQASYGVPVRMALMTALLGLESQVPDYEGGSILSPKHEGAPKYRVYSRSEGLRCASANCVTRAESEKRYLSPRFWIVVGEPLTLRCVYCEHEVKPSVVGNSRSKRYQADVAGWANVDYEDLVLFNSEAEAAAAAGFQPYKRKPYKRKERRTAGAESPETTSETYLVGTDH